MTNRRQRSFVRQKLRRQVTVHGRSRDSARLQGMEALEPRLCLSGIGPFARIVQPTAVLSGSESRVVGGTPTDQFRSVGIIGDRFGGFCSGTLITPRDVATAAHCAVGINNSDGRFSVEGMTYETTSIHVHPSYNDFTLNNDIAVFRLSRPITNIDPSPIFRGTPRVGQILTLVGYGAGGTGASGHTGDFGTKRVGLTPIDGVEETLITWRFDDETESNTAPGDSGGAAFLDVNGQYHLAGITSGGDRWDAGFGDNSFDTRVDSFAGWIDATTESEEDSTGSGDAEDQTTETEEAVVDQTTEIDETIDEQDDETIDKPEPPPLTEDDHADSWGTEATEIVLAEGAATAAGVLEQPGDHDVFQIMVAESGTFVIGATSTDGRLDTYLRIYDAAGNLVGENDDFGGTYDSQLQMDLEPGQYFVDVGAYADWGIGDYQVDLQIVEAGSGPVLETEVVTLTDSGGARLGDELAVAGEARSYTFEATVTGRMTVRTKRLSPGMDTMLTAYDASGYELAFNDDWRGLKSRVRFMVQAGETYRVEVSGYGGSVGSYRLALRTKEVSDSFFFPGAEVSSQELAPPSVELPGSEEVETVEAEVDATIGQVVAEFEGAEADVLWAETDPVVESSGDWWDGISYDIDQYLNEIMDFELDWDSWFVNSWF